MTTRNSSSGWARARRSAETAITSLALTSGRAPADAREQMHPVTLRFASPLEEEFSREYARQTIGVVRLGLVLALTLYCLFGVLDTWIAPAQRHALWFIRYAVVAPSLIVCLVLTTSDLFERLREAVVLLIALILGFGIVAMTSIIPPPGSYLYYAGLLLVIMWIFGLTRLGLLKATAAVVVTIVAYLVTALRLNPTATALVVNNLFFLVSALTVGFCSNYAIERYARANFIQRRVIASRTAELERTNEQLVLRNRMLAESRAETLRTAQRSELIYSAYSDALPGTVLGGKYRVEEKIGAGNFGTVYRGVHLLLNHPVAIKVFRPTVGGSGAEDLERLRLEGISTCRIQHPNAVFVLDFDISPGSLAYLVMELLEGDSVAEALKRSGPFPPARAISVATSVCDVLAEAHAQGVVHRDVKPSNILLHRAKTGEQVKVIDFGIAKLSDDAIPAGAGGNVTVAGTLVGTPVYMSPERLNGDSYDGRTDVYAVGVVLYEMLTGRLPFEVPAGSNYYWRLASAITLADVTPPSQLNAAVPSWLDSLVVRAMAKDPAARLSAATMAAMLREGC